MKAAPAPETVDPATTAKATPRKRAPRKVAPKPATQAPAEPAPPAVQAHKAPAAASEAEPTLAAQAEPAPVDPIDPAPEEHGNRHRYTEAWAKLVEDPGHAPELLALAAVQTVGPRARDWVRRTRDAYPGATDVGLARLATAQFTRFGSLGSLFGAVAGSYASIALLGAAALTQAELILHLAAAYGLDPTDEARAVDLLVLTRVHPDRATAEEAISRAKQPAYEEGGMTGAAWRLGRIIVTKTSGWTAVRLANRFFPGTSLVAATLSMRAATETVAHRADRYYRHAHSQPSQPLGITE